MSSWLQTLRAAHAAKNDDQDDSDRYAKWRSSGGLGLSPAWRGRGNITGLSACTGRRSAKRLELLKEVVPRYTVLLSYGIRLIRTNTGHIEGDPGRTASLGVTLLSLEVKGADDIEPCLYRRSKGSGPGRF